MRFKKKLLIFVIIIVILFLAFFVVDKIHNENSSREAHTSSKYTISVFLNELKPADDTTTPTIDIRAKKDSWYVNGQKYLLYETTWPATNKTVIWRVDLSQLSLCGVHKDVKIFSNTGECDNDILIAKKGSEIYFLFKSDVLDASQYDITDFNIVDKVYLDEYYDELWKEHLRAEHDLSYMLSDSPYDCVWLQLGEHPELYYPLSYCLYHDEFYTKLPAIKE